jgi:hypothetical protein
MDEAPPAWFVFLVVILVATVVAIPALIIADAVRKRRRQIDSRPEFEMKLTGTPVTEKKENDHG